MIERVEITSWSRQARPTWNDNKRVTSIAPLGILHVDMDAFFAHVELLEHPEYRGKPAVVSPHSNRGIVLSATYEARALGIRSAMSTAMALRQVPNLIVMPPHRDLYTKYSAEVMRIFRDFTPLVEPISIDEAFLDVRGATRLLGDPASIAAQIRARVLDETGLTCSVGVASTKFVAKLASDACKPNGLLIVEPDRVLEFLHPLPIRALWGVGPQTAKILERHGLHTVGDIAQTPERSLVSALGESLGHHLYALSWGRDDRAVVPERREKSIGRELTFDADVAERETLTRTLLAQAERVSAQLREAGVECRTVALKVTFADRISVSRSRTLELPTAVSRDMYDTACELLDALVTEQNVDLRHRPVRLIGVRGEQLVSAGAGDTLLWGETNENWREIDKAQDALAAKFGRGTIRPASLLTKPGDRSVDESAHGAARPDRGHTSD